MPELQAAIRALSGVGRASIAWPEPEGPATLRIELLPGVDREDVTASVLRALEDVAEADLSELRVALPPPPSEHDGERTPVVVHHAARNGHRAPARPVIDEISVRRSSLETVVTVALLGYGRRLVGRAEGLATRRGTARSAAAAAVGAVAGAVRPGVRLQIEWVEVTEHEPGGRPTVVHVAVAILSAAGEELVLGSALARDDVREAAVRATLDALNRRLGQLVETSAP